MDIPAPGWLRIFTDTFSPLWVSVLELKICVPSPPPPPDQAGCSGPPYLLRLALAVSLRKLQHAHSTRKCHTGKIMVLSITKHRLVVLPFILIWLASRESCRTVRAVAVSLSQLDCHQSQTAVAVGVCQVLLVTHLHKFRATQALSGLNSHFSSKITFLLGGKQVWRFFFFLFWGFCFRVQGHPQCRATLENTLFNGCSAKYSSALLATLQFTARIHLQWLWL